MKHALWIFLLFNSAVFAQFNFNSWPNGATTGNITNGSCTMSVNIVGSNWNAPNAGGRYDDAGVVYSPSIGTGLALDHNWTNTSTASTVTLTFSPAITNPNFVLFDINRNNPCGITCSNAWSDRVTVQSNTGVLTATPANVTEQVVTNVNSTTKTIQGQMVCGGLGGGVNIQITGVISTITITYASGAVVDRTTTVASPNLCPTGETNCLASRAVCPDPGRQFMTIGSINTVSCLSALPVEFDELNYFCDANTINFNWSTYSEDKNESFELFTSYNGEDFDLVKVIGGSGTTQHISNYKVSIQKNGLNPKYCRLTSTDFSGTTRVLETINIESECEDLGFSCFPNPVLDELNIIGKRTASTCVVIKNVEGKVINQDIQNSSINLIKLNTANWSSGLYIIQILDDYNSEIFKVVKE